MVFFSVRVLCAVWFCEEYRERKFCLMGGLARMLMGFWFWLIVGSFDLYQASPFPDISNYRSPLKPIKWKVLVEPDSQLEVLPSKCENIVLEITSLFSVFRFQNSCLECVSRNKDQTLKVLYISRYHVILCSFFVRGLAQFFQVILRSCSWLKRGGKSFVLSFTFLFSLVWFMNSFLFYFILFYFVARWLPKDVRFSFGSILRKPNWVSIAKTHNFLHTNLFATILINHFFDRSICSTSINQPPNQSSLFNCNCIR